MGMKASKRNYKGNKKILGNNGCFGYLDFGSNSQVNIRPYKYMHIHIYAYYIVHFKHVQLIVYQLYCNKDVKMGRLHPKFLDVEFLLKNIATVGLYSCVTPAGWC